MKKRRLLITLLIIKYYKDHSAKKNVVSASASKQTVIKMYDPIQGLVSKAGAHERSPKPSQTYGDFG